MAENRTTKEFRSHFKFQAAEDRGGYIGRTIKLNNAPPNQKMSDESKVRYEIQNNIKRLVQEKASVEKIKQIIGQKEEYKNYEQYIDGWIGYWVTSLNPQIKSILNKSINRNEEQEEIETKIKESNEEIFELYKEQIQNDIKERKEAKKRKEGSKEEER